MPTRRDLLKLALTLPAAELLAPAHAQNAAAPPTAKAGTDVFADFEGGNWDAWKIEGDAFGSAPATDALFPGKMKGFGGKGFVCTFSPEKGYAATGKATSKEFTIEKPFITFKIGGGKFPGKACLNLVVEGEIVRTETGDGTGRFVDVSWDVSDLAGKKAHFEIVDSTDSQQRGYVLIDDISFRKDKFSDNFVNSDDLPIIEIPLRIVHILDSQGNAEFFGGDRTVLNFKIAKAQVLAINQIYKPAKIVFTISENDLEIRKDDYLNLDFDAPASSSQLGERNRKPSVTGIAEHRKAFQQVWKEKPDRLTILVHRGSEWRWDEKLQQWLFAVGFCHGGTLGLTPARISSTVPRVWAHEIGHTLGLPHTSKDGVDAPSQLITDEDISKFCQAYIDKGGDSAHPEYAIDGDREAGVDDTPPDPGLGFWGKSKILNKNITLRLRDREPINLFVSRNNIMGAIADYGGFTRGQIVVMRSKAENWKKEISKKNQSSSRS